MDDMLEKIRFATFMKQYDLDNRLNSKLNRHEFKAILHCMCKNNGYSISNSDLEVQVNTIYESVEMANSIRWSSPFAVYNSYWYTNEDNSKYRTDVNNIIITSILYLATPII
jgi:hypothetical protein